jgi:hypothetical protein
MGLIANGFRETQTGRIFGSTNVNGGNPHTQEYRGHMTARMRNMFATTAITSNVASVPSGARHPVAWVHARKNGAMSSRNEAGFTFSGTGAGALGFNIDGATSISISFANADGQLISSGTGSASFSINATGNVLAILAATGTASFSLSTNTPLLGATAWVEGAAAYSIGATLVSYGKGFMVGSTVDSGTLTVPAIADGVWNSIAASYNTVGTMGNKLNSAASGGVDYGALGAAVWDVLTSSMTTSGSAGEQLKKALTTSKFLALKD